MAGILDARLDLAVAAAIEGNRPAALNAALGRDIDDPGGAQAVLGRQGAGDQRHPIRQPGTQGLAEYRKALRQNDAVDPVLNAVVLAADMQLAIAVLRHAGRLQHHLV